MNILISSYYGANIRFFDYIIKNLKVKIHVNEYFLNIYPSSLFYMKKYKYNGVFLRNINYKKSKLKIDDKKIREFIKTDLKLNKGKNEKKLKERASIYYNYILDIVEKRKIDFIISSSDEYMIGRILKEISKEKNIKILFFEQGPFGTTILDEQGVNNNISIKNINFEKNKWKAEEFDLKKRDKFYKYDRNYKFYKILDYFFLSCKIFSKEFYRYENIFTIFKQRYFDKIVNFHKKINSDIIEEKYILLILQVPYDVQMLCNSPLYDNFYDIVCDIYRNLPCNMKLLIREHPLYKGKIKNKKIYKFIKEKKDIEVDNETSLEEVLENAALVVVNNSTVGLEALKKYKKVLVLGDAYYDNELLCTKLRKKEELKNKLEEALKMEINKEMIDNFFYLLKNTVYDVHFQDYKFNDQEKIIKKILNIAGMKYGSV